MSNSYDAIIIGAGIIGANIAFEMAKRGKRTLNVDRNPASGYGSTANSCAIIRTYYSTFEGCAMAFEGTRYWEQWNDYLGIEDERGNAIYHECGCILLRTPENNHLKEILATADRLKIPYEVLDNAGLKQRLPVLDLQSFSPAKRPDDPEFGKSNGEMIEGAAWFPQGGYISDPQLATHNLQRAAEKHGAAFRFNASVAEIRQEDGRVAGITLDDGTRLDAPVVVNVAGPHSSVINRMAGVEAGMNIKTRALRHEVAHVPSPVGFDFEKDGTIFSDNDTCAYLRPEVGNHILVGSEDPDCDEREWVDPDDFNRALTDQTRTLALRAAQRVTGLPIADSVKGVVDLYDVTDDWIPIYDKSDLPGFYLAIGTSGNQFKNAPVAAVMMAELIEKCEAGHDHDADPVSVYLEQIGETVSMKFCSRLREVNRNSSFSVLG
ncbi:NAD(P)/FAD-dependent oxidoreductase [Aestuariispira insulae]|uniref:Glycine/D-amino acid oxidase-like deaminating enzyme n=1 Tax=Aestuariispira insulae TaxID=1461337 RepID=A0A3D9HNF3_9PROT|nr:FAD-dependent oxidoreductase [Aestuariispira insulae]RED50831.1 glycine/D-amino acid oxidase-like deaminating enzyme [Aestuariispira insulae]